MMKYEKTVEDYNFGTMLRTSPKSEYEQDATIFGTLRHGGNLGMMKLMTALFSP